MTRVLSLRVWLALLILVSSVPLIVLLLFEVANHVRTDERRVGRLINGLATLTAINVAAELEDVTRTLDVLAARSAVRALDSQHCDPHLFEVRRVKRNYANLSTLDGNGKVLCSSLPAPPGGFPDFGDAPLFLRLKQGSPTAIGGARRGDVSGRWVSFVGVPVKREDGGFAGAVLATIDLATFDPVAKVVLPDGGVIGVISAEGAILARSDRSELSLGRNVSQTAIGQVVLAEKQGQRIMEGNDGVERMYAYLPVEGTDWIAVAGVPAAFLFAPMRSSLWRSGIAALAVLVLAGMSVGFISRRIATPLISLRDAARTFSGDAAGVRAIESGPGEVMEVARTFNMLLESIPLMEAELRQSEARYRALFMATPNAVRVICDGVVVMANPAAETLFAGNSAAGTAQRDVMQSIHPDHRDRTRERIRSVLENGRPLRTEDLVIVRGDGSHAPAELVLQSFEYEGRAAVLSLVTDLSERRRLQQEVEAQRGAAERLVNEMVARQTASAIAHELNQPLAAVSAYSESALALLPEAAHEPEEMARLLRAAADQAQRAGRSLIDLLDALHRSELPREDIDLERALREAPQLGALTREGFKVAFQVQEGLPTVPGNRGQLQMVLGILLQNGRDAMRAADRGVADRRIDVILERMEDGLRVSVRDAGPGIAPEVAARLFEPFFTTKPHGIGIGLHIARALVEAHGGKLWHDASAPAGNTFSFTLPIST